MKEETLQLHLEAWTPTYCTSIVLRAGYCISQRLMRTRIEVGHQHHTHQRSSAQIIKALSFSTNMQDAMHFRLVSFHIWGREVSICARRHVKPKQSAWPRAAASHKDRSRTGFDNMLLKMICRPKQSEQFLNICLLCAVISLLTFVKYCWLLCS